MAIETGRRSNRGQSSGGSNRNRTTSAKEEQKKKESEKSKVEIPPEFESTGLLASSSSSSWHVVGLKSQLPGIILPAPPSLPPASSSSSYSSSHSSLVAFHFLFCYLFNFSDALRIYPPPYNLVGLRFPSRAQAGDCLTLPCKASTLHALFALLIAVACHPSACVGTQEPCRPLNPSQR